MARYTKSRAKGPKPNAPVTARARRSRRRPPSRTRCSSRGCGATRNGCSSSRARVRARLRRLRCRRRRGRRRRHLPGRRRRRGSVSRRTREDRGEPRDPAAWQRSLRRCRPTATRRGDPGSGYTVTAPQGPDAYAARRHSSSRPQEIAEQASSPGQRRDRRRHPDPLGSSVGGEQLSRPDRTRRSRRGERNAGAPICGLSQAAYGGRDAFKTMASFRR